MNSKKGNQTKNGDDDNKRVETKVSIAKKDSNVMAVSKISKTTSKALSISITGDKGKK